MNYNGSKNQSYSHFPWLEEKLKEYELNTDYKIEYLNNFNIKFVSNKKTPKKAWS